jgi:hypothetical protein
VEFGGERFVSDAVNCRASRSFQVQLSRALGIVYSVRTVYRGRLYPSMAAGLSSSLWGPIRRARRIRAGPVTSVV